MDQKTVVKNWLDGANEAWKAISKFAGSKEGHLALFFLHLSLEKTLKGLYLAKFNEPAPFTHDLLQLTDKIGLKTTDVEKKQLAEISTFNIAARYDDYKYRLQERATFEFVKEWTAIGENLRNKFIKEMEKYE
ncbi:MAG: HEPN domain-containing protein [Patescibacteria group bacterium]|nr:HEPN domain-containing protein [Patescibacteria group bacterium]MCL5432104.1 HEPN domain-containing protein [Patescibacteria group bacterium]